MTELRRTAIHEAGHAAIALCLGILFETLSVKPDGDALGHVMVSDDYRDHDRGDAMKFAIFALAGCVAEAISGYDLDGAVDGATHDYRDVDDALRRAFKTDGECARRRSRAYSKTIKLLDKNWALVENLAAALVEKETLTFDETLEIASGAAK
jgi:ATP-dependent Zn protease